MELTFTIKCLDGIWVIIEKKGGRRPATGHEIELWLALKEAKEAIK